MEGIISFKKSIISLSLALILILGMATSGYAKGIDINWLSGDREIDDDDYFSQGLMPVENEDTDKYGFVDVNGKVIIDFIYEDAGVFSKEGLAPVEKNDKWGFIDKTGKVVIDFIYDEAKEFSEGLAAVEKDDDEWGFIDPKGKVVIDFIYEEARSFSEGLAAVEKDDDEWGFIDKTGKVVIDFIYEEARYFSEGLAAVEKDDDEWGFIDPKGKVVIDFIYEEAKEFSEGLAPVEKDDDEWGYIDKTGKVIIDFIYDEAKPFSEGLAAVEKDDNHDDDWGYIDKKGNMVIDFIYDEATKFNEGYAAVEKDDDKVGIIKNPLKSSGGTDKIPTTPSKDTVTGTATTSKILIDGLEIEFDAYKINNENYFKLRDLAKALDGSQSQFEVKWNEKEQRIDLISKDSYTSVGGELEKSKSKTVTGTENKSTINKDGQKIDMRAYTIKGNNYFRLRDVGNEMNFSVDWDGANNTIIIGTK